jgi:hemolysin activation/secretion protein
MRVKRAVTPSIIFGLLFSGAVAALAQVAPAPTPKFDIIRFAITGNTLLSDEELERAVAPFTGRQRDFSDIQRALEALEQAYRDRGYGVVQVLLPEQDITKGVVQFRIVQPKIGKVSVEGNKHFTTDNIRRSFPSLREGEIPSSRNIARNLQMVNEHPVKQATVVLRSAEAVDRIDANIRVTDDKPWRAVLSLANTGTSETGYWRAGLGFQHTNLFDRDHALTAQYITSPTEASKVNIYALGYRAPYYRLNSSFDLFAGYSDVDSGTVQDLFTVSGRGTIFGARWNYYLPKWGEVEQKLIGGLDYRAFQNQVILTGTGQSLVPDVTIHPASLTYAGRLRMAAGELNFYASGSANIPGGSDGHSVDFAAARTGATANYRILRYGASHVQAFVTDWQARAAFSGQYTSHALVPGEQFGIGGPDSVRGYLLREVTNDRGYVTQLELYTPNLSPAMGLLDDYRTRLLVFYDFGSVRRNKTLPGEQEGKFIASAGLGARLSYSRRVSLRVDVAQILKAAGTRQTDEQRVTGSLVILF